MDWLLPFVFQVKGKQTHNLPKEELTMKRTAMMMAVAALVCTVGATGVWAAGPGRTGLQRNCTTAQCRFTDADGDGVCDYRTDGTCRYDADGDGVCDRQGRYFVDEDGDGVCDNRGTGCHGHGWGCQG